MPTDDLQFDRATYEEGHAAGLVCSMCKRPIEGQYWQWLGRAVCGTCRQTVGRLEAQATAPATFVRAALLGTLTALGCGVGYAVFVGVTHAQFALVTIGIAYVVATVLRKATGNVSGTRYQVLAAVLTYLAGAMGYAPGLYGAMGDHSAIGLGTGLTLFGVMLAAPFLSKDWLGLLIIGFGVWEAWRRARPLPMEVTGPHLVPAQPMAPSPG